MSLVGFQAQNHPQQRGKDSIDDRGTDPARQCPLLSGISMTGVEVVEDSTERLVWRVPVESMRAVADPVREWPWWSPEPGTRDQMTDLFMTAELVMEPVGVDGTTVEHIGRILCLIANGWSDPIEVDLYPGGDWWPVVDGNHRLYAAIVRGDETIDVSLSGDIDYARIRLTFAIGSGSTHAAPNAAATAAARDDAAC